MNQGLVIAVFVTRMKLQIAVQKQAHTGLARCDDHALVGAGFAEQHVVGIKAVFSPGGDVVGSPTRAQQGRGAQHAGRRVAGVRTQLAAKQPQRPTRHAHIQQAKQHTRADQAQVRHQQQREGNGHRQRA